MSFYQRGQNPSMPRGVRPDQPGGPGGRYPAHQFVGQPAQQPYSQQNFAIQQPQQGYGQQQGFGGPSQSYQNQTGGPMNHQQRQPPHNYGPPVQQHGGYSNQQMSSQGPAQSQQRVPQQQSQNYSAPQGSNYGTNQPIQAQHQHPSQQMLQQQPSGHQMSQVKQEIMSPQNSTYNRPNVDAKQPISTPPKPAASQTTTNQSQLQEQQQHNKVLPPQKEDKKFIDPVLEAALSNYREKEFEKMFINRYKDESMKKKEIIAEPICLIPMPGVQQKPDNRSRGRQDYKKGRKNEDRTYR